MIILKRKAHEISLKETLQPRIHPRFYIEEREEWRRAREKKEYFEMEKFKHKAAMLKLWKFKKEDQKSLRKKNAISNPSTVIS